MEGGVGYIRGGWREVLTTLEVGGGRCWLHQRWVEGGVGCITARGLTKKNPVLLGLCHFSSIPK